MDTGFKLFTITVPPGKPGTPKIYQEGMLIVFKPIMFQDLKQNRKLNIQPSLEVDNTGIRDR